MVKVFAKTIGPYYIKPAVGMLGWIGTNLVGPAYLIPALIQWRTSSLLHLVGFLS